MNGAHQLGWFDPRRQPLHGVKWVDATEHALDARAIPVVDLADLEAPHIDVIVTGPLQRVH